MTELISAAEKRKQYDTAKDERGKVELEMVIEKINNSKEPFIYLKNGLSKPVEQILSDKGYKHEYVQTGMNESTYCISW